MTDSLLLQPLYCCHVYSFYSYIATNRPDMRTTSFSVPQCIFVDADSFHFVFICFRVKHCETLSCKQGLTQPDRLESFMGSASTHGDVATSI